MSKYEYEYEHREAGMVLPFQPKREQQRGFHTPQAEVCTLPILKCYTTELARWILDNHCPRHPEIVPVPGEEGQGYYYWSYYYKASLHAVVTINDSVRRYVEEQNES